MLGERNTGVQFSCERASTERNVQAVQNDQISVITLTSPLNMSTVHDTIVNEITLPEFLDVTVRVLQ